MIAVFPVVVDGLLLVVPILHKTRDRASAPFLLLNLRFGDGPRCEEPVPQEFDKGGDQLCLVFWQVADIDAFHASSFASRNGMGQDGSHRHAFSVGDWQNLSMREALVIGITAVLIIRGLTRRTD